MTPDRLAALHTQCFETPRPWSAAEFEALLQTKGSFLEVVKEERAASYPKRLHTHPPGRLEARAVPSCSCPTEPDKMQQALGFVIGRVIVDEAELLTLAVHPGCQRHGRGKALLAAYEAEAIKRSASDSFLEVAANNTPAITLYQSAGYTESGRRCGYYSTPKGAKIDAILLRKALI